MPDSKLKDRKIEGAFKRLLEASFLPFFKNSHIVHDHSAAVGVIMFGGDLEGVLVTNLMLT